ncbi:MAG: glycosyltransferase, partial [Lentisphaeria bacterium]|nr:glycosyltransferase [Lentisphaeria bacterium]
VGGLRDFLTDGVNALLFEDNSTDGLLCAYSRLADVRENIIAGGRTTAAEYNWQNIAVRLADLYRGLL